MYIGESRDGVSLFLSANSVIVRNEDLLFRFTDVMEALRDQGWLLPLPWNRTTPKQPAGEEAKQEDFHSRSTSEAQRFYANPANRLRQFDEAQLNYFRSELD